jgi:HlyD family secretion protein
MAYRLLLNDRAKYATLQVGMREDQLISRTADLSLRFVRVEHYVSPIVQLPSERTERVDVRELPVIFRPERPRDSMPYTGQLVDVYVDAGSQPATRNP